MLPADQCRIIDRLVGACLTGERCRQSRGVDAISRKGFGLLTQHGLWRQAAETIVGLYALHPRAQLRFIETWVRDPFQRYIDDDELFFAFVRKVMPPYLGDDALLFRGQLGNESIGASWTISPQAALKFALLGWQKVDPIELALNGPKKPPRDGALILKAAVPASSIICAPHLLFTESVGEYIIDPRGLEFSVEPAAEAAGWIKEQLLEGFDIWADLLAQISQRHGNDGSLQDVLVKASAAGDLEAQFVLTSGMLSNPKVMSYFASRPLRSWPQGLAPGCTARPLGRPAT